MSRYAENTTVSTDKSRAEIERTLQRYGASAFVSGWQNDLAVIQFDMNGRRVKFVLRLPARGDAAFTKTPTGKKRSDTQAIAEWEKACRQQWRALALVVKAKLEAVESGITIFDHEFMAHIVLPDGSTVGEFMSPQIEAAYDAGAMPAMLELGPG